MVVSVWLSVVRQRVWRPLSAFQVDHDGSAMYCKCPRGFVGDSCESYGEMCGTLVCLNGGSCEQEAHDNSVACRCPSVRLQSLVVNVTGDLVSRRIGQPERIVSARVPLHCRGT
jgi:hypothetical protein